MADDKTTKTDDKPTKAEISTKTNPITGSVVKDAAGEPVKVIETKPA